MSCSGTIGRVAVVPRDVRPGVINQALLKLTPKPPITSAFVETWMSSRMFQQAVRESTGGAAIQNVASVGVLKAIRVPVPSAGEQQEFVAQSGELRAGFGRLNSVYRRKLTALDELKRSLLHHAFTGQLTDRTAAALGA